MKSYSVELCCCVRGSRKLDSQPVSYRVYSLPVSCPINSVKGVVLLPVGGRRAGRAERHGGDALQQVLLEGARAPRQLVGRAEGGLVAAGGGPARRRATAATVDLST